MKNRVFSSELIGTYGLKKIALIPFFAWIVFLLYLLYSKIGYALSSQSGKETFLFWLLFSFLTLSFFKIYFKVKQSLKINSFEIMISTAIDDIVINVNDIESVLWDNGYITIFALGSKYSFSSIGSSFDDLLFKEFESMGIKCFVDLSG